MLLRRPIDNFTRTVAKLARKFNTCDEIIKSLTLVIIASRDYQWLRYEAEGNEKAFTIS
jgi:hypothetical protein